MSWSWKRFDRFYLAAQKRHLIETLEERKLNMISALWSNPNFDGTEENPEVRQEAINNIEEKCEEAIQIILFGPKKVTEEEEFELEDPYGFFEAGRRGVARLEEPRNEEATVAEVIDHSH